MELESSSAMAVVVANVGARVGVEAWGGVGWTRRRELPMASYNRAERRRRGRVAELGHDVNGGRNARARDGEGKGVARQGPRGMQWARREGRSRSCARDSFLAEGLGRGCSSIEGGGDTEDGAEGGR